MNTQQIQQIIHNEALPDSCKHADYLETDRSWIIRSDHLFFKIRKPVQCNGTDQSNIENRKNICRKELTLNEILGKKIYKDVIPIKKIYKRKQGIESNRIEVIDYALKMKRPDNTKNLLLHLKKGTVKKSQIKELALLIAAFHNKTNVVKNKFDIDLFRENMEETKRCRLFVKELLSHEYSTFISESIKTSNHILKQYYSFIYERAVRGYIRDGHGNLSADNIFLDDPSYVINREIDDENKRKNDILFDLARLGVDLDYFNFETYDDILFSKHAKKTNSKNDVDTKILYTYFKLYHTSLLIMNLVDNTTMFKFSEQLKRHLTGYFGLVYNYLDFLKKNASLYK